MNVSELCHSLCSQNLANKYRNATHTSYDSVELPQSQKQSLSKPMSSFCGNMLKFKYAQ